MRGRLIAAVMLAVCGCEKKQWTESEIERIAARTVPDRQIEIMALRERVDQLERKVGEQEKYAAAISSDLDATARRVSNNAKVANNNALNEMTRRGACGSEWTTGPTGAPWLRNKQCTEADLAP